MANLIIKSSADNLVLQGSDASPAITVGATGTTTFAENASFTTGNIGTLTSATTFPAGHCINIHSETASNETCSSTVAWVRMTAPLLVISSANGFSMSATARVFIMATVQIDNNSNAYIDFTKHGTGITDTNNWTGSSWGFGTHIHEGTYQYRMIDHISAWDITGTTNDVTYGISIYTTNASYSVYGGGANTFTTLTAMEFAV